MQNTGANKRSDNNRPKISSNQKGGMNMETVLLVMFILLAPLVGLVSFIFSESDLTQQVKKEKAQVDDEMKKAA